MAALALSATGHALRITYLFSLTSARTWGYLVGRRNPRALAGIVLRRLPIEALLARGVPRSHVVTQVAAR